VKTLVERITILPREELAGPFCEKYLVEFIISVTLNWKNCYVLGK
jgi:hypothetical protein